MLVVVVGKMAQRSEDEMILQAIFNPSLQGSVTEAESMKNSAECNENEGIAADVLVNVKRLETEAVLAAENGNYHESLKLFNNAINIAPAHASSYNNRAQLYRLKGNIDAAMTDLNLAIQLSKGNGKAASQAYTQRALLKKVQNDEEGALQDFKLAASLGNSFAQSQVVQMNPYAALCNQMLREAFGKLKRGDADS